MTPLRLLLAGVLASLGFVAITAAPAQACSCVGGEMADLAIRSDAVFVGSLREVRGPAETGVVSSGDPMTYVFSVDAIYQGVTGPTVEVTSARLGPSCGLEGMRAGATYLVLADFDADPDPAADAGHHLTSTLCSGTGPADASRVAQVEAVLGPPSTPTSQTSPMSPMSPIEAAESARSALASWSGLLRWG